MQELNPSKQAIRLNQGEVVSVRGSVIDARFTESLPQIYNLLKAGETMIEVLVHLSPETVRGIALTPAQGLARGSLIIDTGRPIMVPIGKKLLGRAFNVFGSPIDHMDQVEAKEFRSIHRESVPLSEQTTDSEISDRDQSHRRSRTAAARWKSWPFRRRRCRKNSPDHGADSEHGQQI